MGEIIMRFFRQKYLIIFLIIIVYVIWHYEDIRLWFHSVSPAGSEFESLQQIKDDLNVVNEGRYDIEDIYSSTIDQDYMENLMFEEYQKIVEPYASSGEQEAVQISFSEESSVNDFSRSKEVMVREAVNMMYFLNQRKLKDSIKVVHFVYKPNYGFVMVGTNKIFIPVDEFKTKLEQNRDDSIEKTLMKVTLYYYDQIIDLNGE
jgi:hypothetical protein